MVRYDAESVYYLTMHVFQPTDKGRAIALESGLDELAIKLAESDSIHPLIDNLLSDRWEYYPGEDDEQATVEQSAVTYVAEYAKGYEETRTLARGLAIDHEADSWRFLDENDQLTLFPHEKMISLLPAIEEDRLVVSGVAGVMLAKYKARYPVLARSRYAEFGFDNHMEACAFAGAYVLGKIIDEKRKYYKAPPSFKLRDDRIKEEVIASGSIHGDFVIGLTKTVRKGAISPAHSSVEFAPRGTVWVLGYHSVEPDIVAGMITDVYIRHGADEALQLLVDFENSLEDITGAKGTLDFKQGPFGDYGFGDVHFSLSKLRIMIERPETKQHIMKLGNLYSAPYSPQSDTLFEIKSFEDGLRIQNRKDDFPEPATGIDVPQSHYTEFFKTLVMQTQAGMGRTSPQQLVKVLEYAKDILSAP